MTATLQCPAMDVSGADAAAGVVLDPVYSGKALFNFAQDVRQDPGAWEGRSVLFLHTGKMLYTFSRSSKARL